QRRSASSFPLKRLTSSDFPCRDFGLAAVEFVERVFDCLSVALGCHDRMLPPTIPVAPRVRAQCPSPRIHSASVGSHGPLEPHPSSPSIAPCSRAVFGVRANRRPTAS